MNQTEVDFINLKVLKKFLKYAHGNIQKLATVALHFPEYDWKYTRQNLQFCQFQFFNFPKCLQIIAQFGIICKINPKFQFKSQKWEPV